MKMVLQQHGPLGQEFTLTLECPDFTAQQEADLSTNDGDARIYQLLRRELNRCVEISTVSIQDADAARKAPPARRLAAGEKRPPAQIVGVGTKDQDSRLVEHEDKFLAATALPRGHKLHAESVKKGKE